MTKRDEIERLLAAVPLGGLDRRTYERMARVILDTGGEMNLDLWGFPEFAARWDEIMGLVDLDGEKYAALEKLVDEMGKQIGDLQVRNARQARMIRRIQSLSIFGEEA